MITPDGPKVIEYNCRFGDPETQVVLPLLESDLFTIMRAVSEGRLAETEVRFSTGAACCVVMASDGYPVHYEKGFEITVDDGLDAQVYIAGAKDEGGRLLTNGGRVLGVVATADDLAQAVKKAYENVEKVHFANAYYRRDIGKRALEA
ncbi:MAG: phosphoribosylglycinamide synthetase C domain-containing protein, partial [Oscillospiraceae bacterium]